MLPLVEELYDTKEEQTEALKTYSAFFNTEPQLGTVIVGMTAGLEEAKANGEDIDGEMINGIRAGLMGPVAGIGDSLLVGTLIPILLGVALGLSSGGSPLGAIFYIIAYNVILTLGMRLLYFKGYELGGKAVEMIPSAKRRTPSARALLCSVRSLSARLPQAGFRLQRRLSCPVIYRSRRMCWIPYSPSSCRWLPLCSVTG